MKISIVIPCYRSENTIPIVVHSLQDTFENRPEYEYEIILVNDSSPDNVWGKIETLCEEDHRVKGVCLAKNFGQHSALMAGYSKCTGEYVVSMDDDGQTSACEIFKLIEKLEEGYDVVYADYPQKRESAFRLVGSRFNERMNEVMLQKPKDIVPNSYFVMRKFICDEIVKYKNAYPYIDGLIFRSTKKIGKVSINHCERIEGSSGYTLGKLISLWMNGFTTFSIKPLRFASVVGSICAVSGFICGLVIIIIRIMDTAPVEGWTSLVAIILFIGGLNMLMLGMVGEYLGRTYLCINNTPQFIVREEKNLSE